ncbi:MAG: response regulator transcription factor [Desulfobacterales bacterium]|nr:response regulator transcription factor [Desulfobacterales bacterium]
MIGKKRIVIAEDHTLLREGLAAMLADEADLEVVAEAANGLEAVRCVEKHEPDLILLDLAMPKMNGISAIKDIHKRFGQVKILAVTIQTDDEYILASFESGANGYCLKQSGREEFLNAIRKVLDGKRYISPEISDQVLDGFLAGKKRLKTDTRWESLTQREKEVLKLIGEGYKNAEIADFLCISPKTVDKHRSNIMKKLDLHNAAALTAYAIDKGLVVAG